MTKFSDEKEKVKGVECDKIRRGRTTQIVGKKRRKTDPKSIKLARKRTAAMLV